MYGIQNFDFNSLIMQTYGNPDVTYGWWVGNSVVTNRAGRFIGSHIGHTGLICFAAGGSTLWELARYNPEIPMGHQSSIFLAHLASLGIGFDAVSYTHLRAHET